MAVRGGAGDAGHGITVDPEGNVYTVGEYYARGTAGYLVDFPTGHVVGSGGYGVYLLKFVPEVSDNNWPTIDNITVEPKEPYTDMTEDEAIVFTAVATDGDGDSLTYTWDFGDGNSVTTTDPTFEHTYLWGGTFDVTLTVNDGRGGIDDSTTTANVEEVNDVPVADPGGPYGGRVGDIISFDASASSDYDNSDGTAANDQPLTYEWDFNYDGEFVKDAEGVTVTHAFATSGDYTVALKVTDGQDFNISTVIVPISEATAALTLDDGDPGYSEGGPGGHLWTTEPGGYAGVDGVSDYRTVPKRGSGFDAFLRAAGAYWDFAGLPAGTYEVLATWVAQDDGATNAPFEIINTGTSKVLKKVRVDQSEPPVGPDGFQSLGTVTLSGNTLTVQLTNLANGRVVADAVRIIPVSSGSSSAAQSTAPDTEAALAAALSTFDVSTNIRQLSTAMGPAPDAFANSRDAQTPNAVDGLFGSYAPAVDLLDLLVDDRFLPASHERRGEDYAVDLVLGDIAAGPFDQQLVEDLALALI